MAIIQTNMREPVVVCERYFHSINDDGAPKQEQIVWAYNVNHGWREPSMFRDGKFWLMFGILKGYELPNVTHWQELKSGDPL